MKTLIRNSGLLLLSLAAAICYGQGKSQYAKKPNILFAIADDVSWEHMGAHFCQWIKTPAFDRVAQEGILFTHAYTPNAKCAPSRSCILTGRNSWQLKEAANHSPYFPAEFKTYAEALGENGYWVGSTAKGWSPGEPGTIDGKPRQLTGPKFDQFKTEPPAKFINANDYARNFEDFLNARPNGKPFCFWYGSTEPHRAYEYGAGVKKSGKTMDMVDKVPAFWPDTDTIRTDMLDYAFEIEYFDSHLMKMIKKLEETGELDNTLVVVTADNGMPFPRAKGNVYEYSNHLPLAIMWPKGIKNPGRIVDDYVNFIDFAPTFLELAGLTARKCGMQPVEGKSLTDIFNSGKCGKVNPERNFVLVCMERHDVGRPGDVGYPVRGIVKDEYLYLFNFKPDRWPACNPETGYLNADGGPTKTFVLNDRHVKGNQHYWQLCFGKRPSEELYRIAADPFCMNNLAEKKEFSALKTKLHNEMRKKLADQQDPRVLGDGDVFDTYEYAGEVKGYYEKYLKGEIGPTNWVEKTDYEPEWTGRKSK